MAFDLDFESPPPNYSPFFLRTTREIIEWAKNKKKERINFISSHSLPHKSYPHIVAS